MMAVDTDIIDLDNFVVGVIRLFYECRCLTRHVFVQIKVKYIGFYSLPNIK